MCQYKRLGRCGLANTKHPASRDISVQNTQSSRCKILSQQGIFDYKHVRSVGMFLILHREPPSKSVTLKYDLLLIFQTRRLRLDTNSKCQYDNKAHRQKTSHIDDDLILVVKNRHMQSRLLLSD
jgi:hypothetical protein